MFNVGDDVILKATSIYNRQNAKIRSVIYYQGSNEVWGYGITAEVNGDMEVPYNYIKKESEYIKRQKEEARNLEELTDHLIKLVESDDKRFLFVGGTNNTMSIYDKEKSFDYVVHITPIEYDENGNATNL